MLLLLLIVVLVVGVVVAVVSLDTNARKGHLYKIALTTTFTS